LEILAATFAANALVLNSFLRDKGPKRAKFKGHVDSDGSRSGNHNGRRGTEAGAAYWGSDEDLVRDVGFGVDLETTTTAGAEVSYILRRRNPSEVVLTKHILSFRRRTQQHYVLLNRYNLDTTPTKHL